MTKKQKNLKQLIDGAIQKLSKNQAGNYLLVDKEGLERALVRIARATAGAGKIGQMRNKIKDSVYPEYFKGRNDGWNMAGKQQQKQLKEFLGSINYENKKVP